MRARSIDGRCSQCDRLLATEDADRCSDSCECASCLSKCWLNFNLECYGDIVDWRERAVAAEGQVRELRDEVQMLRERLSGKRDLDE